MSIFGYSKRSFVDTEQVLAKRVCIRDQYCLPDNAGMPGQVLTAGSDSKTAWGNPGGYDQSLNTTDDVQFDQVSVQQFDLKSAPNALSISKSGGSSTYAIGATGFNCRKRAQNAGGGIGSVFARTRGSLDVPLGVLNNDGLFDNDVWSSWFNSFYQCNRELERGQSRYKFTKEYC